MNGDHLVTFTASVDREVHRGLAGPVTVNLSGTSADFATTPHVIPAASTAGTYLLTVAAVNDRSVEQATQTYGGRVLNVLAAGGGDVTAAGTSGTATITVADNDVAALSITGSRTVTEVADAGHSTSCVVTLNLSGATGTTGAVQLDVPVAADLALAGVTDFTTGGGGDVRRVHRVRHRGVQQHPHPHGHGGERRAAGGRHRVLHHRPGHANDHGADAVSGSGTILVTDNESATVSVTSGTTAVTEAGASALAQVALARVIDGTGDTGLDVQVRANLAGIADYAAAAAAFDPATGGSFTADVTVTAVNDNLVEQTAQSSAGQAVAVTQTGGATVIVAAGCGTRTVEVSDNDSATIRLSGSTSATEGGATGTLTATLTLAPTGTGTASLQTVVTGVTVPGNADFTSPVASFGVGAASGDFVQMTQTATNDRLLEGTQSFTATLSAPISNAAVGTVGTGSVTIVDDDSARSPSPFRPAPQARGPGRRRSPPPSATAWTTPSRPRRRSRSPALPRARRPLWRSPTTCAWTATRRTPWASRAWPTRAGG